MEMEVEDELACCEKTGVDLELDIFDGEEVAEEEALQLGFVRGGVHGPGLRRGGREDAAESFRPASAMMTARNSSNSAGKPFP